MDTTISWTTGGFGAAGAAPAGAADERRLAHIRALREAVAQEPRSAGRLAAAKAALGGLLGRRAPAAASSPGLSLDTVYCLA